MTVRPAVVGDGSAIAAVHVASWRKVYDGVLAPETLSGLDESELASQWDEGIGEGDDRIRYLVLEDGPAVVGYARTGPNRDEDVSGEVAELYGFYTHPEVWGTGAGNELMDEVLADFRAQGYGSATLWVVIDNPRARRFYEKKGWRHEPDSPTNLCFGAPETRYRIVL